jgi:hypothetical protein
MPAHIKELREMLARERGVLDESAVASFAERQRLVDKAAFDAMEIRYGAGAPTA